MGGDLVQNRKILCDCASALMVDLRRNAGVRVCKGRSDGHLAGHFCLDPHSLKSDRTRRGGGARDRSLQPQRLLNRALRFLPARQLLDIRHPALEVRVVVERQPLPLMHVHRRCNSNIRDRHLVARKPF